MNNKDKVCRSEYYNDNYFDDDSDNTILDDDVIDYEDHSDKNKQKILKRHPKKKKHILRKLLFKLLVFILLLIIIMLAVGYTLTLFIPNVSNVLIMATDAEGTRTDTIMVASYNKNKDNLTFISIPRDTYVTVDDDIFTVMRSEFPQPGSKSMKINTIHHFAGEKYGVDFLKKEVSKLLNLRIDYYIKLDFDAFRYVIDAVGGIEFDVPRDMKYSDPYQDLYIDLKKGMQHLDGNQSEQLLRYRSGYANADIGRIDVQLSFIKEFISQTLSKGTILTHPSVYLNAVFKYNYLETDAGIFDIISYGMLIGGINADNIDTCTLPGYPAMRQGQSVYLPKVSEIVDTVSKITSN